jgi:hypothetical protein
MGGLIARVLERGLFLYGAGLSAEDQGPDRLRADLARPEGLATWVSEALQKGEEGIAEPLGQDAPGRCTFCGLGGLLP